MSRNEDFIDLDEHEFCTAKRDWALMPNLIGVSALETLALGFPPSLKPKDLVLCRAILTNLGLADRVGQWVSYSRNAQFYADRKRYKVPGYTYRRTLMLVDLLFTLGLIEEERQRKYGFGLQSRMRATAKLVSSLGPLPNPHWAPPELIILRDRAGSHLAYEDTAEIRSMRTEVSHYNEALSSLELALPGFDLTLPTLELGRAFLRPWVRANYRIFLRDFRTCGRLYGGWWQQCPKSVRATLLINGEPVREPDFASLHPRLLYALCGQEFRGDAYSLPTDYFKRETIKAAWQRLVNANSRPQAFAAMRKEFPGLSQVEMETLFAALEMRHAPIRAYFYKCPATLLQYIDSELLLAVLDVCLSENIVGLSIHDSLIVRQSHAARVEEIMQEMLGHVLLQLKSAASGQTVVTGWPRGPLPRWKA